MVDFKKLLAAERAAEAIPVVEFTPPTPAPVVPPVNAPELETEGAAEPEEEALVWTPGQEEALRAADELRPGQTMILSGVAGSGKTSVMRAIILRWTRAKRGGVMLMAPTGRAALRLSNVTGDAATTVHRAIYEPDINERNQEVKFKRREDKLSAELIGVDECSMISRDMHIDLQAVTSADAATIHIGDDFQLPPVEPGVKEPFSILDPARFKPEVRVHLTDIVRQASGNPIITASLAVRKGDCRLKGLTVLRTTDPAAGREAVRVRASGGVIICHTNIRRKKLNAAFRRMAGMSGLPREGEPLAVWKNNYRVDLYNGEEFVFPGWVVEPEPIRIYDAWAKAEFEASVGVVSMKGISRTGEELVTMCPEEVDGTLEANPQAIAYAARDWSFMSGHKIERTAASGAVRTVAIGHMHAQFGYASTCHRMQGDQRREVVVFQEPSVRLSKLDGRRWLYTAITRAEENCIVIR